jgi:ring-1,2-phenylacetyl-CoA epoxidase subunit PaaD
MTTYVREELVAAVRSAVEGVSDPELAGVSIGSLGMVGSVEAVADAPTGGPSGAISGAVHVLLIPTFLGCPALRHIAHDVEQAALRAGALRVEVTFDHRTPWTTDRIDPNGRRHLAELGIAVGNSLGVECPYCHSSQLQLVSAVGPASCRSAHWCAECRNIVEVFRDSAPSRTHLPLPRRQHAHI